MEIRYPSYYQAFSCIASACPDSCCHEWEVDVDPETAAMYRNLPGALGDRLRSVLREGEDGWASMAITDDRRCPMWRSDGLCQIQAELGHEALCTTCRNFPRLRHDYGNFVELGLELSCPETARLILHSPATEWVCETVPGGEEPAYENWKMELLQNSRQEAVSILEDPSMTPGQALAVLLLYGYAVQDALDWNEPVDFSPANALHEAISLAQSGNIEDVLAIYRDLEILTPRWWELLSKGVTAPNWSESHRALTRYFVDRYWLQAISDGDLVCRVKFVIVSCLIICALGSDLVQTAQLYSKEIENDADNVEMLLDAAYTSPALADVGLLYLLTK